MKLSRYASNKENPAIKGDLTAEEIVRTDWERNYKSKGIPFVQAKMAVKAHVDAGGAVFRVRNTLVLVTPLDDWTEVKFHTITADPQEVYQSMMLMLLLSMNKNKGTEIAVTYVPDKSPLRVVKRIIGPEFVELEESDNPDIGKYMITIDLARFVRAMQGKLAQMQRQGSK